MVAEKESEAQAGLTCTCTWVYTCSRQDYMY